MKTSLGGFLRKIRLSNGEILKDMAENLGVSSAFLSAVENGKKKMPESWYKKLMDLYNLTDQQQEELKQAVFESSEIVELNIKDASEENKDLAICFARNFNSLDEETSKQIFEILNRHGLEDK